MPGAESPARRLRATFMRGGTSKGLMVVANDLPRDAAMRDAMFLAAMGSPDPYGRQLNGMGGGVSSLSKVCIVGATNRPGADVDYTFGQVLVGEARIDWAGNCGNMSSAVGPFAALRGLVSVPTDGQAVVLINNTNTGKIIRSTFAMRDGEPVLEGSLAIDGVSGSGAPIRLDFMEPGGSKTGQLLPGTGATEYFDIGGRVIAASLVDAGNPCVFAKGEDFGLAAPPMPDAIDTDARLLADLEQLRREASVRMGLAANLAEAAMLGSIPKVALLFAPAWHEILSGRSLDDSACDIVVRMLSMEKAHRALPITGAICLAAAMRIPGSIAASLARSTQVLRIGHPSGVIDVDAEVERTATGEPVVRHASVFRTARRLFEGEVFC